MLMMADDQISINAKEKVWFCDSRCSNHMTGAMHYLILVILLEKPWSLVMTPKSQVVKLSAIEMIEVMNSHQVYSENGIKKTIYSYLYSTTKLSIWEKK
jgi:hypothetical protein